MMDKQEKVPLDILVQEIEPLDESVMSGLKQALASPLTARDRDIIAFEYMIYENTSSLGVDGNIGAVVAYPGKHERMQRHPLRHKLDRLAVCAPPALGVISELEGRDDVRTALSEMSALLGESAGTPLAFTAFVTSAGIIAVMEWPPEARMKDANVGMGQLTRGFVFTGSSAHKRLEFMSRMGYIAQHCCDRLHYYDLREYRPG